MVDDANGDLVSFEVDSSLLVQLGEQLVARRSIALAELIKNAYDADATRVRVVMQSVTTARGSILVDDDGVGMTLDDLRRGWMRVATTAKANEPISTKFGRARAGSKGIGRFAARRLGQKLLLSSTAQYPDGAKRCVEIAFDWQRDFVPGTDLGSTRVRFVLRDVGAKASTGTALLIENLDCETWAPSDVQDLQRDLLSLTPPFDIAPPLHSESSGHADPGFSVSLEAPEFPDLEGELKDHLLEAAWGVLSGHVGADARPHFSLTVSETKEHLEFSPEDVVYPSVGPITLSVHFLVYRAEAFRGLAFGSRDARRYGGDFGGIRLYIDGFRVFPYGDPGDDWLQLDFFRARRLHSTQSILGSRVSDVLDASVGRAGTDRGLLLTPGNNQLFGAVMASRTTSPGIITNVSREQVLENDAFGELRHFAQLGIFWMTLQYARLTSTRRKKEKTGRESPSQLIAAAQKAVAGTVLDASTKQAVLSELQRAGAAVEDEREQHISQIQLLRVMSATGAALSIFNHQIGTIGLTLLAIQNDLSGLQDYILQGGRDLYASTLHSVETATRLFTEQQSQLSALLEQRYRARAVRINLHELVDDVFRPLRSYCADQAIGLQNGVPSGLMSPAMYRAELYAVIMHLATNAIKAVEQVRDRAIVVRARNESGTIIVQMLDTGVGLDRSKRDEVFDYFVSYSTPHQVLGIGTGIGLAVVRDTVEDYAGTVHFVDAEPPWKTCIELRLPVRGRRQRQ